jgi:hypothetical protein
MVRLQGIAIAVQCVNEIILCRCQIIKIKLIGGDTAFAGVIVIGESAVRVKTDDVQQLKVGIGRVINRCPLFRCVVGIAGACVGSGVGVEVVSFLSFLSGLSSSESSEELLSLELLKASLSLGKANARTIASTATTDIIMTGRSHLFFFGPFGVP